MERSLFVGRVRRLAGVPSDEEAERVLQAIAAALRACLPDADAVAVSSGVPEPVAAVFSRGLHESRFDLAVLVTRTRLALSTSEGTALELVAAVCRALGEASSDDALDRLRHAVSSDIGALFAIPAAAEEPPPHRRAEVRRVNPPTLADGRPGSRNPLSEARPERAHVHSVARSDEPHSDGKLSSAHGTTQEGTGESLATGKPPQPRRPVSGG